MTEYQQKEFKPSLNKVKDLTPPLATVYGANYEDYPRHPFDTTAAAARWGAQFAEQGYHSFVYLNSDEHHMFRNNPATGVPPTNAELFIYAGHGTENSQLKLKGEDVIIDYADMTNLFNNRSGPADFSDCRLAIFLACNSADKEVHTVVGGVLSAAVECGARAAFGFNGKIKEYTVYKFMDYMMGPLLKGESIGEAARYARSRIRLPFLNREYHIHGDAGTCLSLPGK